MADKDEAKNAEGAEGGDSSGGLVGKLKKVLGHKWTVPLGGAAVSAGLAVALSGVLFPVVDPEAEPEIVEELDPAEELEALGPPVKVPLPKVQVSLADTERDSFARMVLHVEFRSPSAGAIQGAVEGDLAVVLHDAMITYFSDKHYEDFKLPQSKELMKVELIDILDSLLFPDKNEGRVTNVYYEEFLVQ